MRTPQEARLRLVVDNSLARHAEGGTAPLVTPSISIARSSDGLCAPLRQRVTVGRDTGGSSSRAKSSSRMPFVFRYSSSVMRLMCISRTLSSSTICTPRVVVARPGRRDTGRMANRLKILRVQRKLTQEKLGEMLDVSHATIQRWETGQQRLTDERINELARALNVKPWEIVGDEESARNLEAFERVLSVADGMTSEQLETWLKLGRALHTSSDKTAS